MSSDPAGASICCELDAAESELHRKGLGPICGVDEAGRGPLAGPVVVAAVVLSHRRRVAGVRDSKKLSPASREELAAEIRVSALEYAIVAVDHEEIDRLNILTATLEGMRRAVESLDLRPALVLVDGNRLPKFEAEAGEEWRAVVKGDDRFASIAAASILAKVERDHIMVQLDRRYPGYGFAGHKGYPTVQHRRALSEMGPCPVHRRSFRLDYRS
ncbi:MAG: ribonuclease HII [Gemmatimonadetes bacterium]|nr:ribonuclease HII [Gemmatimonadota bacterium]